METNKIGTKVKAAVARGKQRVQNAVSQGAPKKVQKKARKVSQSAKKPHPGTDPRQPDDRDGNEGFHRASSPMSSEPVRKAPRQTSPRKASPKAKQTKKK